MGDTTEAPASSAPNHASVAAQIAAMQKGGTPPAAPHTQQPGANTQATQAPPADGETPPASSTTLPSREATKAKQALADLTKAEAQMLEWKGKHGALATEVADLKAKLAAWDKAVETRDYNVLLRQAKVGPEQLAKDFMEGRVKFTSEPEAPKFEMPPDVAEAVEYAKQAREREQREKDSAEYTRLRGEDVEAIKRDLAPFAEKYPLSAALPGVADRVYDAMAAHAEAHGGELPTLESVLQQAEPKVRAEILAVGASEHALKVLLEDPNVAAKARALLGLPAGGGRQVPAPLTNKGVNGVPSTTTKAASYAEVAARIQAAKTGA